MWTMELATNTMTAESRIGSKRAVRETMRSLLGSKDECRKFRREATAERGCGQELVPASGALRQAQSKQGSPSQKSAGVNLAPLAVSVNSSRLNSSHEWISYAVFCLK